MPSLIWTMFFFSIQDHTYYRETHLGQFSISHLIRVSFGRIVLWGRKDNFSRQHAADERHLIRIILTDAFYDLDLRFLRSDSPHSLGEHGEQVLGGGGLLVQHLAHCRDKVGSHSGTSRSFCHPDEWILLLRKYRPITGSQKFTATFDPHRLAKNGCLGGL